MTAPATPPGGARRIADSRVEMTELVLPEDANVQGYVFGGRVMALIDKAGAMAAIRHCRSRVVTAAVDSIDFISPLRLGYIMSFYAHLTQVFSSSLEVRVDVYGEDPRTGIRTLTTTAFVTMVCLDSEGRPKKAPELVLESPEEKAEAEKALERRRLRLARRKS